MALNIVDSSDILVCPQINAFLFFINIVLVFLTFLISNAHYNHSQAPNPLSQSLCP